MSAQPGRKPVDPNETTSQKLSRLAGSRVTKLKNSITAVANLGPLVHDFAKESGTNPEAVIVQIVSVVQEDFKNMVAALQAGKRAESVFNLNL